MRRSHTAAEVSCFVRNVIWHTRARGWSRVELAEKSGLEPSAIGECLSGTGPSAADERAIAEALHVSLQRLWAVDTSAPENEPCAAGEDDENAACLLRHKHGEDRTSLHSKPLMQSSDVMHMLAISQKTLHRLRRKGEIEWLYVGQKLIRFRPEHVQDYIDRAAVPAVNPDDPDGPATRKREQETAAAVEAGHEIVRKVKHAEELRAQRAREKLQSPNDGDTRS